MSLTSNLINFLLFIAGVISIGFAVFDTRSWDLMIDSLNLANDKDLPLLGEKGEWYKKESIAFAKSATDMRLVREVLTLVLALVVVDVVPQVSSSGLLSVCWFFVCLYWTVLSTRDTYCSYILHTKSDDELIDFFSYIARSPERGHFKIKNKVDKFLEARKQEEK